jgi:hypothetical protein
MLKKAAAFGYADAIQHRLSGDNQDGRRIASSRNAAEPFGH